MNKHAIIITCLLLICVQAHVQGQADSAAAVARQDLGRRIRARTSSESLIGVLRDVHADSLFIQVDPGDQIDPGYRPRRALSAATLTQLDVQQQLTPTRRNQRGFIGLVVGALVAGVAGSALAVPVVHGIEFAPNNQGAPFQEADYVLFPVLGAIAGGTVGWIAGHYRSRTWLVQFRTAR
jgi:hypothetical protein